MHWRPIPVREGRLTSASSEVRVAIVFAPSSLCWMPLVLVSAVAAVHIVLITVGRRAGSAIIGPLSGPSVVHSPAEFSEGARRRRSRI
ncbi:hypothetical protein M514_13166 [Trichuris suis]|uniref:Uncharacterized protein n=1 Tax=Trichuris suis TaxID=68888 RepID=A0A085MUL4_9BILA